MLYHSTRNSQDRVDSAQAVLMGLAPDGGLYVPQHLPEFDWQACLSGSSLDMSTVILSAVDTDTLKKLGMHLTCDPVYEEEDRKYHKK